MPNTYEHLAAAVFVLEELGINPQIEEHACRENWVIKIPYNNGNLLWGEKSQITISANRAKNQVCFWVEGHNPEGELDYPQMIQAILESNSSETERLKSRTYDDRVLRTLVPEDSPPIMIGKTQVCGISFRIADNFLIPGSLFSGVMEFGYCTQSNSTDPRIVWEKLLA